MSWRLANSLVTLRNQIDATWPNRSRASDGTIGDAAHQAEPSDHNPNAAGVVCALDITNSPPYFDAHALADKLLAVRHPDLKYLISNRRIAGAWSGWAWTAYLGSDPHINHIHISVGIGGDGQSTPPYDDTNNWNVKGGAVDQATQNKIDYANQVSGAFAKVSDPAVASNAGNGPQMQLAIADYDRWKQLGPKLQAENVDLQVKLDAALKAQPGIDPATKAELDQTSSDVSWIRALLNKIFK